MKVLYFVLSVLLFYIFLDYCVAHKCGLIHTLASNGFDPIDVNITATPFCFECPATAAYFSLNGETLMNAPPDVVIDSTTASIYNWSAVPLKLLFSNMIACREKDVGFTRETYFFSLTPGPLTLFDNLSYYIEGGNNTNVQCVNFNARPGYNVRKEIWMNSAGEVVGNGLTLNLSATRDNAGIYTCTVPDVPLILPVMFEVVIYPLASDEKEYSSTSTTLTSTVVNSTGNIIVATLLSIIVVAIVLTAIILFLIFQKKIKNEHFSKSQISENSIQEHYAPEVDVRNQQSFDELHLTDEETMQGYETDLYATVDEDMKKRNKDVVNFDNDKDEKKNNAKCPDISELYAVVDKNRSQQADKEISDIYSVVDKSKRKDKVDDKLPDVYATVDKTKKESKVNDNAELSDMYATVDKTKKNKQVNDTELSEMYATVDKTKKKSK